VLLLRKTLPVAAADDDIDPGESLHKRRGGAGDPVDCVDCDSSRSEGVHIRTSIRRGTNETCNSLNGTEARSQTAASLDQDIRTNFPDSSKALTMIDPV
jgi:hypothetical protein